MRYRNRTHAGIVLAEALAQAGFGTLALQVVVAGVARGGVAVAAPVAAAFSARLEVVIARKLRAPQNPELAIGAVGAGGEAFVDEVLVRRLGVDEAYLGAEVARQRADIADRARRYGVTASGPAVADCEVVVVDDGVATGATLIAALRSIRSAGPRRLVCAVPVGPADTLTTLERECDLVVCPMRPQRFAAVGEWYTDFTQTDDEEVMALLVPPSRP